jgi:hypothetical protein
MNTGSTGIVVDITPVKSAYTSKMPNWQFRIALSRRSQCCTFVYEPFQQCVYGNALPPGFISKTCFDLSRNLGSASAVSPPSVAALSNSSSRRLDHHPA